MHSHEVERKMRAVPVTTPVVIELNGKLYDIKEMEWQGWKNGGFTIVRLVDPPKSAALICDELQTAKAVRKELQSILYYIAASRKPIPARIEIATLGRCVYPPLDIAHNNALAPIESYISKRMEELRCLDAK